MSVLIREFIVYYEIEINFCGIRLGDIIKENEVIKLPQKDNGLEFFLLHLFYNITDSRTGGRPNLFPHMTNKNWSVLIKDKIDPLDNKNFVTFQKRNKKQVYKEVYPITQVQFLFFKLNSVLINNTIHEIRLKYPRYNDDNGVEESKGNEEDEGDEGSTTKDTIRTRKTKGKCMGRCHGGCG